MTRIVTCYYGKLNMAKRIYKKYQVSLNTSNIWDNSPKSDILLKTYIWKTPTFRRSDVRICQLVPVSNLDHFLPGAADAVSIKNRWYSAKGRYGAVQTPWRQRSFKEKVLQCSTAQGWYSASTMMRSLKKQRQDAFLLITSLRGHSLASPVSKREINKAGAVPSEHEDASQPIAVDCSAPCSTCLCDYSSDRFDWRLFQNQGKEEEWKSLFLSH